jgi:hypothetical protein
MAEHTPGPYEIEEILNASHSNHQRFWSYGVKAGKIRIAVCCDVPGIKENAHLFAAAPETAAERDRLREVNAELLAALKTLRKGLTIACRQEAPYIKWLLSEADPAISKAEGKS